MESVDLFDIRETFNRQNIMICFNGPFSRSIIEELGNAVKRYMENAAIEKGAMMDVFSVYIEQTQNVRNYVTNRYPDDPVLQSAVIVIANKDDHYIVSAGNIVDDADARVLSERLEPLRSLDKAGLKALYKEQMRKPRDPSVATGAGLGLIDMARKAAVPMDYTIKPIGNGRSFFSLRVVI